MDIQCEKLWQLHLRLLVFRFQLLIHLAVLEILKQAHQRGATVVVATHSRELLEAYPARVVVLKAGQVVRDERPAEGGSIRVREGPPRGGKEEG